MTKKDFIKAHPVGGWCKGPTAKRTPLLKFGRIDVPAFVDNRSYCTAVEDQGSKPWCAAYTAAAFAENVMWRRDGRITQVEPEPIYKWAKAHDGDPDGEGTSLDCALNGLLSLKGLFGEDCKVRFVDADETSVKAAIHRFGCFLGGFNITEEWYDLNGRSDPVVSGSPRKQLGGHAVLVCGYGARGVWIENSWSDKWGDAGFGLLSWSAFKEQFMYGTVLTHCLDGFK